MKQKNMDKSSKMLLAIFAILMLAFAAAAYGFYSQSNVLKSEIAAIKQDPQKVIQEENQALINRIGALIALPEGETPTIATVNDPDLLKDQPFFAKAKKGDKVLIYPNAKKAILYDPESNKIIEVAPLTIGAPAGAVESSETPQE